MFSGGAASAANAADIQSKYNGGFETLRNSQAAAAVSTVCSYYCMLDNFHAMIFSQISRNILN